MLKTREMIADEIRGMSEPQIVDYIVDLNDRLADVTNQLNVTTLNLSLAMDGGAEKQKEYDKLKEEYDALKKEKQALELKNRKLTEDLKILRKDRFNTGPEADPLGNTKPGTNQGQNARQTQGTEGSQEESMNNGEPSGSGSEGQANTENATGPKNATGSDDKAGNQGPTKGDGGKVEQPSKESKRKPPKRNPAAAKANFEDLPTFHTFMNIEELVEQLQILYPGRKIEFAFEDKPVERVHRVPENCTKEIRHRPIFKIYRADGSYFLVNIEDEYLKRGIPVGADFMAALFYNRIIMSQPLNRQNTSLHDFGCKTPLSKISDWNISMSREFLKPVSDYLMKHLFDKYKIIQGDESRWNCVEFVKEGYAFIMTSSELGEIDENGEKKPSIICIKIQEGRECGFLESYLKSRAHILVVDGYSGYTALQKSPVLELDIAGCWVHKRRRYIEAFDVLPAEIRKDPDLLKETLEWLLLAAYGSVFHYDTPTKKWDREHRLLARQLLAKPFVEFILETEEMVRNILSLTAADADEEEATVEEEDKKRRILSKIEEIYSMMRETGVLPDSTTESTDLDALIKERKIEVDKTIAYLKERREAIFAKLDPTTVGDHLRKAVTYRMNRTSDFLLFLTDPDIPIDNNNSERVARKIAAGRSNYYCTRTWKGNEALESQFTLGLTAQANNVNPFIYYVYVLKKVSKYKRDHFMKEDDDNFSDEFLATMTPWSKEFKEFAEKETDYIYYGFLLQNRTPTFQLKKKSQEAINSLNATKNTDLTPNAEILDALNNTENTCSMPGSESTDTPNTTENTNSPHSTMTLSDLLDMESKSTPDPNSIQDVKVACSYTCEPVMKAQSKEVAEPQKTRGP